MGVALELLLDRGHNPRVVMPNVEYADASGKVEVLRSVGIP
jgi:hypothetical protein